MPIGAYYSNITVTSILYFCISVYFTEVCYFNVAALRIGFSKPVHELSEANGSHSLSMVLVKEDNISTEQTFSLKISALTVPTILPAFQLTNIDDTIDGKDFALTGSSGVLQYFHFPPELQLYGINLTIFDDDMAEGEEAFLLQSTWYDVPGVPSYDFPIYSYSGTTVFIQDNDGKVNFTLIATVL